MRHEVSLDAGPGVAASSPFQIGPLADGVHSIEVTAFDRAGNSRTAGAGAFIDTVAPPAPLAFRGIEGVDKVELVWEQPAVDVVSYRVERTPAWDGGPRSVAGLSLVDEDLVAGSTFAYHIVAVDRAGHESPPATDSSVVGIAVAPVDLGEPGGTIEFENVELFWATEALPEGTAKIEVTTATSQELEGRAVFGLASPIYEFAVSVYDAEGTHRENGTEFTSEFIGMIHYDESMLPEGFPEENVGLFYWDTMWSQWARVDKFAVDVELNAILFATSHFTLFSVQPTMIQDLSPQELSDVGYSPFKSQVTQGGVTVSAQGGSAMTEVTEFVLPGKAGFDFVLRRMYDTATARGDSPGSVINMALSFSLNSLAESASELVRLADADALGSLLEGIGSSVLSQIRAKIDGIFRNCGDYAYATGVGWRLALPYIRSAGGRVLVRTPSGSFYPVNNMDVADASYVLTTRQLVLENHEGEDFTLVVRQILAPTNVTTLGAGGFVLTLPVLSWLMTDAQMIMKDGTTWSFDALGRVTRLVDGTGTNTIEFAYGGLLGYFLETITDSMGHVLRFSYEDGGPLDIVPRIASITLEDDVRARTVRYTYTEETIGGLTIPGVSLLASATDAVGRTWNYGYDWTLMLEGNVSVKVNLIGILIDLIPGARLFLRNTVPPSLTLSGRLSSEIACTLGSIEGPGSGYVRINTTKRSFVGVAIEVTDCLFGFIPTGIEGSLEFPSQLYTSSIEEYVALGGTHLKTTSYQYNFHYAGNHQVVNTRTSISDGKTVAIHYYAMTMKQRRTYLTWVDYLTSLNLFMAPTTYREKIPYETGFTIATTTGFVLEQAALAYDLATMRLAARTVHRGARHSLETTWTFDAWGNVKESVETTVDDDVVTSRTTATSYFVQRWAGDFPNVAPADSPYRLPSLARPRMDLPLGRRISFSVPAAAGAATIRHQDTWYRYDELGRKIAETVQASGRSLETRFVYDSNSELLRLESPSGIGDSLVTRFERDYSLDGYYLVRTIREDVDLAAGITTDLASVVWNERSTGLKLYERDARGYLSAWTYDAVGRPTRVIKPDDADPLNVDPLEGAAFLADNPTTTIVYDDSAYTVTVTGPRGQQSVYDFDQAGHLESIKRDVRRLDEEGRPLASGAQLQETLVGHDGWGNITSIVDPNGHRTDYGYDAMSRLSKVEYPSDDGQRPRRTISFDYTRNFQTTIDERGYVTIEHHDMAGRRLATVSYPDEPGGTGRAITTSTAYDGLGRESVTTDELGGVTAKSYDERGNLIEVVSPSSTFFEEGNERTYTPRKLMSYDDAGALVSESFVTAEGTFVTRFANNQVGLPLSMERPYTDRLSGTAVAAFARELYGYDAVGNRISSVDANDASRPSTEQKPLSTSYSARGKVLVETDRAGNRTTYAYDGDDNVVNVTDPRGNDPAYRGNYAAKFWYDDVNRLVRAIIPSAEGGDAVATIAFEYDPRGNLRRRIDADGTVTTYSYSARNKPVTEQRTDQAGTTGIRTERTYDAAALEIATLVGGLYRTSFTRDGAGRLVLTALPSGSYEKIGYDEAGNVACFEDGNGHATTFTFDSYHRVIEETDALGNRHLFAYDARGNLTRDVDANGNARLMGYDELGRMVSEQRADGAITSWAHDAVGNLTWSRDAEGIETRYVFTDDYHVALVTRNDDTREQVQAYSWDRAGNRVSASNDLVTIEYNLYGLDGYRSDPYGRVKQLRATIAGQPYTASWKHDEAGRVTGVEYPDGREQAWRYDGIGLLAEVEGWTAIGSVHRDDGGRLLGYALVNGVAVEQSWDTDGRLARLAYLGGEVGGALPSYGYTYDRAGDLIAKGDSSYRYDEVRRLVHADETDRTKLDRVVMAAAAVEDYQGQADLVFTSPEVELKLDRGSTSIGAELGGERDLVGLTVYPDAPGHRVRARNIEVWARSGSAYARIPGIRVTVTVEGNLEIVFEEPVVATAIKVHCFYDERNADDQVVDFAQFKNRGSKLLSFTYRLRRQIQGFRYDAKGNRLEVTRTFADGSGSTSMQESLSYWPSSDRVKTFSGWTCVYDAKGRLLEKGTEYGEGVGFAASSGEYVKYSWDLFDRLETVYRSSVGTQGAVEAVRFGYDPDGMRVQREERGEYTRWVYGPDGNPIFEVSESCIREFVYTEGKILGYWETVNGTTQRYFTLTDQVGSVVSTTNELGIEVARRNYLAFGGEVGVEGDLATPALFTGKEWDAAAGLYYFNARWYDPELGRFISEDPIMDGPNWYAYVANSPLMRTDPTGLGPREWIQDMKSALKSAYRTAKDLYQRVKAELNEPASAPETEEVSGDTAENLEEEIQENLDQPYVPSFRQEQDAEHPRDDCDIWAEKRMNQGGVQLPAQWNEATKTTVMKHIRDMAGLFTNSPGLGWYLVLLEDSTRTGEEGHAALVRIAKSGSVRVYEMGGHQNYKSGFVDFKSVEAYETQGYIARGKKWFDTYHYFKLEF